jgi:type I restriction enzyme, S subunit
MTNNKTNTFSKNDKIPKDWKVMKIKDLLILIIDKRGKTPKKLGIEWTNQGIPVISAMNVDNGHLQKMQGIRFISIDAYDKWMSEKLQKGDILLTSEAPLGKVMLVTDPKYCIGQRLFALRPNSKLIDSKYLYYYLLSDEGQKELSKRATGSTAQGIRQKELMKINVILPTLSEQQKISSILENIDNLMQSSKKILNKLKILKRGLLQRLFTKGIGHSKFKKIKINFKNIQEIPETWSIKKLDEVVDILDSMRKPVKRQDRDSQQKKYPYYGASGVIDHVENYIFDEKLLCLGEDGENLVSRTLPIAFTINGKTWVNNHAHVLRPTKIDHKFLEYYLNYISLSRFITGTAQPKLNQKVMNSIPILYPTLSEQQKISSILENIDLKIKKINEYKLNLEIVKKNLLRKMISGEINPINLK